MPKYKYSGWLVDPETAFKNTDPKIIIKMNPMPETGRADIKEYIDNQFRMLKAARRKETQALQAAAAERKANALNRQ